MEHVCAEGRLARVQDVVLAPPEHEHLAGRNLEWPKARLGLNSRWLRIVGWACGRREPAVAVEVTCAGAARRRAAVMVERPDLAEAFPDVPWAGRSGFRLEVPLVILDPHLELGVQAVLASHRRVPVATITAGALPSPHPLVSVIIPCYRQAHFLADAVESVLAQTYREVEVIVVDDGSTDNTAAVASAYPGLRYLYQRNQGLAAARNAGLSLARGEYVVFLDADDRLLPRALEDGLATFERHPAAHFVAGRWRMIDVNGDPIASDDAPFPEDGEPYLALLRMCFISSPAAVLYRREAVEEAGGFDPSVDASADYAMYLRLARDRGAAVHDEVVAEYRRHAANMTANPRLILRSELAVLRGELERRQLTEQQAEACLAGISRSVNYHGKSIMRETQAALAEGRWLDAARDLPWLVRVQTGSRTSRLGARRVPAGSPNGEAPGRLLASSGTRSRR